MVVSGERGEFELDLPTEQWQHVATWLHDHGEPALAVRLLSSIAAARTRGEDSARLPVPSRLRHALGVWLANQGLQLRSTRDGGAWCIKGIEPPPTQALSYLAVLVREPAAATPEEHLDAAVRLLDGDQDVAAGEPPPRKQVTLNVGGPVTRYRPSWEDISVLDHRDHFRELHRARVSGVARPGWLRRGWRAVFGRRGR